MSTAKELDEFLSKKRATKDDKLKWAKNVIDEAVKIVQDKGELFTIRGKNVENSQPNVSLRNILT